MPLVTSNVAASPRRILALVRSHDGRASPTDAVYSYDFLEELEAGFARAGGWRIELGERELARDRVTKW